jgi:hypothetical protein
LWQNKLHKYYFLLIGLVFYTLYYVFADREPPAMELYIQRDATELDGPIKGGRQLAPQYFGDTKMRSLIFRTAIAALFISTPFATAYAASGGSHGSHDSGGSRTSHEGRSVSNARQNFNRIELDDESNEGTTSPSYLFGSHMDTHSMFHLN